MLSRASAWACLDAAGQYGAKGRVLDCPRRQNHTDPHGAANAENLLSHLFPARMSACPVIMNSKLQEHWDFG
jgi:hypothetical protein